MSGAIDKSLRGSLQIVLLRGNVCKRAHSLPIMFIPESNTSKVKRTLSKSKIIVGVVPNHVKKGLIIAFQKLRKIQTLSLINSMKPLGLLNFFFRFVEKVQ